MGPLTSGAGPRLHERRAALDVLERLIAAARSGDGGAAFCVGEPGVGKSAPGGTRTCNLLIRDK